jgi:hypothetical protein
LYNAGVGENVRMCEEDWIERQVHTLLSVVRENPQVVEYLTR